MDSLSQWMIAIDNFLATYVVPAKLLMAVLLGTGLFLTLRLGFIQFRRLRHGIAVTSGKYDDPEETGDVSHFQALSTALSATVGVGNIAGVATALHWGGPGALFWMWVTALTGMAVKFTEVTLALKYRDVEDPDKVTQSSGSVSGGPMYYIEKGLGTQWKPLAIFVGICVILVSFMGSNALQANTLTDQVHANLDIAPWMTAMVTTVIVALVMFGGIKRIGKVTSVLMPAMGILYAAGALIILGMHLPQIPQAFMLIITEAFNPTAGLAGTGTGAFLMTLEWGVRRGLFSNEAGQGSAPIAHAAAQTNEPVSEGVVALLEPFIDTIVICTLTGLVICVTQTWNQRFPTELELTSGDISYRIYDENGRNVAGAAPERIPVVDGVPQYPDQSGQLSWHEVPIERFFVDEAHAEVFNGEINPIAQSAISDDGATLTSLYGLAVETAAPLTSEAFGSVFGLAGKWLVMLCVVLFALSTILAWSYYGDRASRYVFGVKGVLPFKCLYLVFHYLGATAPLQPLWNLSDRFLAMVAIPNLIALLLLSRVVKQETDSYFERKPWEKK